MSERAGDVDYLDVLSQPSGERELAAQAPKKKAKRKMSRKQRAAALANLAKAHKKAGHKKSARSGKAKAKKHTLSKTRTMHFVSSHPRGAKKKMSARWRKMSPAARMKVLRALAKGRRVAKSNAKKETAGKPKTHRLTPRRALRSTSRKSEAIAMKKGKGSKGRKGKSKATRKQRAAARKNIKKAQAALRAKRAGRKSGKRSGKSKTLAKRKASHAVRPPTPRKAARTGRKGKAKRRFTQKARAAALRNLGKARSARKRAKAAGRKHAVRAYSYHSRPKRVKVKAHRSYERGHRQSAKARAASLRNLKKARAALRHGGRRRSVAHEGYMEAMVNALTGVEVVIGFGSALFWFMVTDFVDRMLATHALTDKGSKDASGHELYADTPPTTGDYAGLFNPTAICAPMNVTRWLVGLLGMTGVPMAISFAVGNDVGRAALQAASFGAGIRIVGKALIDLVSYVTMWNPIGQQLYDGEMRAQVYASGNTDPLASLPSTGLGKTGTGAAANDADAPKDKDKDKAGTGWPSTPRETANARSTTPSDGAPPPPAPPVRRDTQPGPSEPGYLAGLPPARKNPYLWGHKESQEVAA